MAAIPGRIKTDTLDWASRACGVSDFSPAAQDKVAVYLITRRGALRDIEAWRLADAITKCRKEWASLPGAGYGQREHKFQALREQYLSHGGVDNGVQQ